MATAVLDHVDVDPGDGSPSFEVNGTPVTVPNAPAALTSEASTAPVRVDEQGAVVTDVG